MIQKNRNSPSPRFDQALDTVIDRVRGAMDLLAPHGEIVLIVRDLMGSFRIFLDRPHLADEAWDDDDWSEGQELPRDDDLSSFSAKLTAELGRFSPPNGIVQIASSSFPRAGFFDSPDGWTPLDGPDNLRLVDRLVTGREWLLPPASNTGVQPPRAVFFGIKGGVGRTTTLAMLAWHLSRQGKNVLVVDLDLESPGLGPILLPLSDLENEGDRSFPGWPEFGVADWFVEDAAGQADDALLRDMIGDSPLASRGEIKVVPASGGKIDQDYISKLSRAYLEMPRRDSSPEIFGDRLARMLDQLEEHCKPDVVLLDCRAGLHDISSAALTRLGAHSFLFAVDSRQTWEGYRHLFRHWLRHPDQLRVLRKNLHTFASLVPNGVQEGEYRRTFSEHAHSVFLQIYDQPGIEDTATITPNEIFNFAPDAEEAPHYPVLVRYHPDYAFFAPLERELQLDAAKVENAFGDFLRFATDVLFPEADAQ